MQVSGFLSGAVQPRGRRGEKSLQAGKGRRADRSPSLCAPAFLTSRIDVIRPDDTDANIFGIDVRRSYDKLYRCCKLFTDYEHIPFTFVPVNNTTQLQRLSQLIDYFDGILKHFGLELHTSRLDEYQKETNVLEYTIYRNGYEMECRIIVLHVAPADYLSPEGSRLFKRFMKFYSENTNIALGVVNNYDNFYLDYLLEWYVERDYYDDEESQKEKEKYRKVFEGYKEDGKFWNLFDEIESQKGVTDESLQRELEAYLKVCPEDEEELMKAMYDGIPIVKHMNIYSFVFNPDVDGLPDENGYCDDNTWNSSVLCSAILYSDNDGLCDSLLESISSDQYCGVMFYGWNYHLRLTPKTKRKDLRYFIDHKDIISEYASWESDFYNAASKFDNYGKS